MNNFRKTVCNIFGNYLRKTYTTKSVNTKSKILMRSNDDIKIDELLASTNNYINDTNHHIKRMNSYLSKTLF